MDAALNWVLARPWCILPADLETICAVAVRQNESPEAVEARLGRPLENTRLVTFRDAPDGSRTAILPVHGPIARYANLFTEVSGATSVQVLATDLQTALEDPAVRSIVLDINSPGGEATGINDLAQYIRAGRERKPIVAFVDGACASGAYWLASAASAIVTSGTGMLGSIGVVMKSRSPDDRPGAPLETVSSGAPYKRIDNRTEAGRAHLQALVNDLEAVFVAEVAAGRGVAEARVRADFGQGGLLVGQKAVAAGMADGVGTLESVVDRLLAGGTFRPARTKEEPSRGLNMKFRDRVAAWFAAGQPDDFEPVAAVPPPSPPPPPAPPAPPPTRPEPQAPPVAGPDPHLAELHRQIADMKAARRQDALAGIRKDALAWLKEPAVQSRITAREMDLLGRLYVALATVDLDAGGDAQAPRVQVGEAQETLVRALDASVRARPAHRLYDELTIEEAGRVYAGARVLGGDDAGADPTVQYDLDRAEAAAKSRNRNPTA